MVGWTNDRACQRNPLDRGRTGDAASAEKIWRTLAQAAQIGDWLMKNDFQPVAGRRFNFRITPMPHWNGVVDCEILTVKPHKRLA